MWNSPKNQWFVWYTSYTLCFFLMGFVQHKWNRNWPRNAPRVEYVSTSITTKWAVGRLQQVKVEIIGLKLNMDADKTLGPLMCIQGLLFICTRTHDYSPPSHFLGPQNSSYHHCWYIFSSDLWLVTSSFLLVKLLFSSTCGFRQKIGHLQIWWFKIHHLSSFPYYYYLISLLHSPPLVVNPAFFWTQPNIKLFLYYIHIYIYNTIIIQS